MRLSTEYGAAQYIMTMTMTVAWYLMPRQSGLTLANLLRKRVKILRGTQDLGSVPSVRRTWLSQLFKLAPIQQRDSLQRCRVRREVSQSSQLLCKCRGREALLPRDRSRTHSSAKNRRSLFPLGLHLSMSMIDSRRFFAESGSAQL